MQFIYIYLRQTALPNLPFKFTILVPNTLKTKIKLIMLHHFKNIMVLLIY